MEERLNEVKEQKRAPVESRYLSTTDPEVLLVREKKAQTLVQDVSVGGCKAQGDYGNPVNAEGSRWRDLLGEMIEVHEQNIRKKGETVVADIL